MFIIIALITVVLLLSYANGANDISKGIATLIGSGITSYRKAIAWGTVWTIAGGLMASVFAYELVKTFSVAGIIDGSESFRQTFPIAVGLGAFAWVQFTARTGLPVSTTHSITGAIVGAGVAAVGAEGITWTFLGGKIFLPLLFSPLIALVVSYLLTPIVIRFSTRLERYCLCVGEKNPALNPDMRGPVSTMSPQNMIAGSGVTVSTKENCDETVEVSGQYGMLEILHWLSAGMASFARGLNDAPKIAALLLGAGALGTNLPVSVSFLIVAAAMGGGSFLAGLRVTETLSEKVTPMTPQEGFSANLTTSVLVTVASRLGMPVSTTHVSSGAIFGIGLKHGRRTVKWKTVTEMIFAWIITLPVSGLAAFSVYKLIY